MAQLRQNIWDNLKASTIADTLLDDAHDSRTRARLLASTAKESGAWLNVLPISSLGLLMDNDTIRVAVGLRLGAPLYADPTHAVIVVHRLTFRQLTDLVVDRVRVATIATLL